MPPRLFVHVEGQTEEHFVKQILAPYLVERAGYTSVVPRLVGNARQRDRRGGIKGWDAVRQDILDQMREDRQSFATTLVDYYGLPQTGPKAWPGRQAASSQSFDNKASIVESALLSDICAELGEALDACRFIPFVVMHEFEGLLFSDCAAFADGIGAPDLAPSLSAIRSAFETPEEINDSPNTAPSKRLQQLMPRYRKPLLATQAASRIGLHTIRSECPHFRRWLEVLEARGQATAHG